MLDVVEGNSSSFLHNLQMMLVLSIISPLTLQKPKKRHTALLRCFGVSKIALNFSILFQCCCFLQKTITISKNTEKMLATFSIHSCFTICFLSWILSVVFRLLAGIGYLPITLTLTLHKLLHVTLDYISHAPLHWLQSHLQAITHTSNTRP